MTHDELVAEWQKDNNIDATSIQKELVRTPFLHSKYLALYMQARSKLIIAEKKYGEMRGVKRKYYTGKMDRAELEHYGWDQWGGLKLSNTELLLVCDEDPDMTVLNQKVEYYKMLVQGLDHIMKSINSRGYELKTLVEHEKYLNGM